MFAKIINNTIEYAPESIIKDNKAYLNYNLESNAKRLMADGYKPVEDSSLPEDMNKPSKSYQETDDKIITIYTETYIEPTYYEKRASNYPNFHEYLDAMVKINSGDETLNTQGQIQLNNYYQLCLEVKNNYPKT